ncbi:MAG: hypothetical protein QM571_04910 [Micrococcaceae bacterium]
MFSDKRIEEIEALADKPIPAGAKLHRLTNEIPSEQIPVDIVGEHLGLFRRYMRVNNLDKNEAVQQLVYYALENLEEEIEKNERKIKAKYSHIDLNK